MDSRIQSWLHQWQTWFSEAKTNATEPDEALTRLPAGITQKLRQAIRTLPPPDLYQTAIRESIETAVQAWQNNLDAANSLVILSSPVERIGTILEASLQDWQPEGVTLVAPLAGYSRPADPLAVPAQLHNALDPERQQASSQEGSASAQQITGSVPVPPSPDVSQPAPLDQRKTVVVIPSLEQCFLRCIQGWEGIEYLQNLITHDPTRFWLFGCNSWSWTFLDRVCQISAYLEHVFPLPSLEATDLQAWLTPIMTQALIPAEADSETETSAANEEPAPQASAEELTEESTEESIESLANRLGSESTWKAMVSLANGIAACAAELWVESLRVRQDDLPEEVANAEAQLSLTEEPVIVVEMPLKLHLNKPVIPSLPSLTTMDRYILHSLLIHGGMTRINQSALSLSHLALSLGEAEREIRSRVQVLRRTEVILQIGDWLTVNPIFYPKLRSELSNNNFLIGDR